MRAEMTARGIWQDVCDMPANLEETLGRADGIDTLADRLVDESVRRVVATGNGASYYVAQALWLASLDGQRCPKEVIAVPSGLVAGRSIRVVFVSGVVALVVLALVVRRVMVERTLEIETAPSLDES